MVGRRAPINVTLEVFKTYIKCFCEKYSFVLATLKEGLNKFPMDIVMVTASYPEIIGHSVRVISHHSKGKNQSAKRGGVFTVSKLVYSSSNHIRLLFYTKRYIGLES